MSSSAELKGSHSEEIIAPEILNDALYKAIIALCTFENLTHVLEIGSSAGGGSTSAFVHGLSLNKGRPTLYCMEVSTPRFKQLQKTYEHLDFVKCYNVSSISSSRIASEDAVKEFYRAHKTALNQTSLSTVLGWRDEGIRYMTEVAGLDRDGILMIKEENGIDTFDLVLIDGSEFTGVPEFDDIYGAKIIILDDVDAYKCFEVREKLLIDPAYRLLAENLELRNGFSIFYRADMAGHLDIAAAMVEAMKPDANVFKPKLRKAFRQVKRALPRG